MPTVRRPVSSPRHRSLACLAVASLVLGAAVPLGMTRGAGPARVDHLVVSEVVTGGASASDELIELHNPTLAPLPLEGLELIYVSASGATVTRRAIWELGAPVVPGGGHVLVANEAGSFAPIADAVYASGMAATGGSVALRIQGATTAIDAVGWGNAANGWMEGAAAPAPAAGASLERLPGGALGSSLDTDDNLADFVERAVPDPRNLASPPTPDPDTGPSAAPSVQPTPEPTASPSPTPSADPVADARAAPDGTIVTIEGIALTSHDFHDGGGFVADASGGIAVLVTGGGFGRGAHLRITGQVDDRFAQRTLRAASAGIEQLGIGSDPTPAITATGAVTESVEGELVRTAGIVGGSPTPLSTGVAVDLDDGSGAVRLVVGTGTGIDLAGWVSGARLELVGVAGQRDSSGGGTSGYRVMPRAAADIVTVTAPASPLPSPSGGGGSASPSPSPNAAAIVPIDRARRVALGGTVAVRGTVTLPSGLVDEGSAVIQDGTGAVLVRLGSDAGSLGLGQRVEVTGIRSTLGGMDSIRASQPPRRLGQAPAPDPVRVRTGMVGEEQEALLVVARGALVASARRFPSGTVSFEIDDGSGPLRVSAAAPVGVDDGALEQGSWVEVRGVLGQETSGSAPLDGYRIWPRAAAEVRATAAAGDGGEDGATGSDGSDGTGAVSGGGPAGSLQEIGSVDLAALRVGATLVAGPWRELGVGGLLWDGTRLVAIDAASARLVTGAVEQRRLPVFLELSGLQANGTEPNTGAPRVALGRAPGQVVVVSGPPSPPRGALDGPRPAWVSLTGRLSGPGARTVLVVGEESVPIEHRCRDGVLGDGFVTVTAVAVGDAVRLLVPCGGIRSTPTLDRAPADRSARAPGESSGVAAAAERSMPDDDRRWAGMLMLVAAAVLGTAAVVRRLHGGSTPDPSEPPLADSAAPPADARRLTLVGVPREHGP